MGMFFANYSGLHDICNAILNINAKEYFPEKGIGIVNYLGCSQENVIF
jgi:hypothetical protein